MLFLVGNKYFYLLQNLLAGSVFGTSLGFPLVCFLTAVGASTCYMLSYLFGKSLLVKYFPEKVQFFQEKVSFHRMYYLKKIF